MPRPAKISFLITDLHRGGSPLLLASLAPALAAHHQGATFNVEVISIAPHGELAATLTSRGIPVTSLDASSNRDPRPLPRLIAHLRARQPNLICSILIHANILATLAKSFIPNPAGTKPIVWIHSIHTLQHRPRWHWYAQGLIAPFADALIAPSRAIITKLNAYGPIPRPIIIPNGIDVPRFYNAQPIPPDERPWPRGAFIAGYIGRFDPVKRLDLLLRAAAHLLAQNPSSPLHLALIGYGPQEAPLWRLAKKLSLTARLHIIPATKVPERWFKTFNVFCLPSAGEGFGLTLAEALTAGLPIITCDTPAIRATLDGFPDPFWLSQNPSPEELARALQAALRPTRYPPVPLELLQNRYSAPAMADSYARAFQQLLGLPDDV